MPVVTRGAGTGLSGGALPHEQGLLLSLARLPQLNAVKLPAGVDEAKLRSILLNDYSLEVGAGLGALAGKILRIGLMGHACNRRNISLCLSALATALPQAQATTTKVAQT